jgi:hypothetical protein
MASSISFLAMAAISAVVAGPLQNRMEPSFDPCITGHIIRVGQPTPGRPVELHGVVGRVDNANHRVDIINLTGFDYFWGPTVRNCPVAPSVSLDTLAPGNKVRFTLSRGIDKRYFVSSIQADL